MRKLFLLLSIASIGLNSCKDDYSTDVQSGREFLARLAPRNQHFGPGVTEFTGEKGIWISVQGPFISLATGDTLTGQPEFWLQEFRTSKEMMYAGIPTESNNHVLETGGAFKLAAKINGVPVKMGYVQFFVPNPVENSNMQFFFGDAEAESFWSLDFPSDTTIFSSSGLQWVISGEMGPGFSGFVYAGANYLYTLDALYVNCDYFLVQGLPSTAVQVRTTSEAPTTPQNTSVSILFNDAQVYMDGYWNGTSGYQFQNLPLDYAITCLAVSVIDGDLYFGMTEATVSDSAIYTVALEPITEEELENILNGL
ncbi:MAG: hypothetical protein K9J06_10515 [Flavobacteriales bacterium]|nr:hypothetical protein [Flavobacteriales bacterium]